MAKIPSMKNTYAKHACHPKYRCHGRSDCSRVRSRQLTFALREEEIQGESSSKNICSFVYFFFIVQNLTLSSIAVLSNLPCCVRRSSNSVRIVDRRVEALVGPMPEVQRRRPMIQPLYLLSLRGCSKWIRAVSIMSTFYWRNTLFIEIARRDKREDRFQRFSAFKNVSQKNNNLRQVSRAPAMTVFTGTWADKRPNATIFSPVSGWNEES